MKRTKSFNYLHIWVVRRAALSPAWSSTEVYLEVRERCGNNICRRRLDKAASHTSASSACVVMWWKLVQLCNAGPWHGASIVCRIIQGVAHTAHSMHVSTILSHPFKTHYPLKHHINRKLIDMYKYKISGLFSFTSDFYSTVTLKALGDLCLSPSARRWSRPYK